MGRLQGLNTKCLKRTNPTGVIPELLPKRPALKPAKPRATECREEGTESAPVHVRVKRVKPRVLQSLPLPVTQDCCEVLVGSALKHPNLGQLPAVLPADFLSPSPGGDPTSAVTAPGGRPRPQH